MRTTTAILVFCTALITSGCAGNKLSHQQVAWLFVTNLHDYAVEKDQNHYKKLIEISSELTMAMIHDMELVNYSSPNEECKYRFVRDSLSVDKMKAFVWYTFVEELESNTAPKQIRLRQSIRGWIVDMPHK